MCFLTGNKEVLSSGRHISPLSSGCANGSYLAVCMTRIFSGSRLIFGPFGVNKFGLIL